MARLKETRMLIVTSSEVDDTESHPLNISSCWERYIKILVIYIIVTLNNNLGYLTVYLCIYAESLKKKKNHKVKYDAWFAANPIITQASFL